MASNIPRIIIIGPTGILGSTVTRSFQLPQYNDKVTLSLLVRKETAETDGPKKDAIDGYVKNGATLVYGDITQPEAELLKAFSNIDVLIAAVGFGQTADQLKLIPIAKAAGVRWFVPSSFGWDGDAIGNDSFGTGIDLKNKVLATIKEAGLDWTTFNTGIFAEFSFSHFFGVDLDKSTVFAPASLSTRANATPMADVGLAVADAITTGKGRNQTIYTGVPVTYEEIAVTVEKATGKKLTRVVRSIAELQGAVAKDPNNFVLNFAILIGSQKGISWPVETTYASKNGLPVFDYETFVKAKLTQ
jgi:hypothetical protein